MFSCFSVEVGVPITAMTKEIKLIDRSRSDFVILLVIITVANLTLAQLLIYGNEQSLHAHDALGIERSMQCSAGVFALLFVASRLT